MQMFACAISARIAQSQRRQPAHALTWLCCVLVIGSLACTGTIDGILRSSQAPGQSTSGTCDVSFSPASLRLLTTPEYEKTVVAALGLKAIDISALSDNQRTPGGFLTTAGASLTSDRVSQFLLTAEAIGAEAIKQQPQLSACTIGSEKQCIEAFLDRQGTLLFRRPLTSQERTAYLNVFDKESKAGASYTDAFQALLQVVLQSPQTLYRRETGAVDSNGLMRLDGISIANRLAFMIFGQGPDFDLVSRASKPGALNSVDAIRAEASAMLSDPRAIDGITAFFQQWSHSDALGKQQADAVGIDPLLMPEITLELKAFIREALISNVSVAGLLSAINLKPSEKMAAYYAASMDSPGFEFEPRSGLLTRAAWLVASSSASTIPTRRGKFILEQMLCQSIPRPQALPGAAVLPKPDPTRTTRERFEAHATQACTGACHVTMDPIGFAFENFDARGVYRATENNKPINASGSLPAIGSGQFTNAKEFMQHVAQNQAVLPCLASRMYEYSLQSPSAHAENPNGCAANEVVKTAKASGGTLRDLILAIVTSDEFRFSQRCSSK